MKNRLLLSIYALLLFNFCFAQGNKELPESLDSKEIRIIKSSERGNIELIRIFEKSNLKWNFELYETDLQGNMFYSEGMRILDSNLWLNILATEILNIPDQKEINYKFRRYQEVDLSDNSNIISYEKPQVIKEKENYHFLIREKEQINSVTYSNPDLYFKMYPEIDELSSVVNLLNLIRNEFCESTLPRKLCEF